MDNPPCGFNIDDALTHNPLDVPESPSSACDTHSSHPSSPTSQVSRYETGDDYYQSPTFWYAKIHALCQRFWPDARHEVVLLTTGLYNKIFGVSVLEDDGAKWAEYILRLPELDDTVANTVAVLRLLHLRLAESGSVFEALNLPEVVKWDATNDNELNYPYVVMKRMPGTDLGTCWRTLTHEQKIAVSRQIGLLYQELLSFTYPVAGTIGIPPSAESSRGTEKDEIAGPEEPVATVSVFGSTLWGDGSVSSPDTENDVIPLERLRSDPPGLSVGEMMLAPLKRRIYQSLHGTAHSFNMAERYYEPLANILENLDRNGTFRSCDHLGDQTKNFCLWHTDLVPSNIMVDLTTEDSPKITGVLDWETPLFGPRFMAAKPPLWLWNGDDADAATDNDLFDSTSDDDNNSNNLESLHGRAEKLDSAEDEAVRDAFEVVVGPEWCRMAYSIEYILARRILDLSVLDLWGMNHVYEVEDIQSAWEEHRGAKQGKGHEQEISEALDQVSLGEKVK